MNLSGHFVEAEPGRIFVTAWQNQTESQTAILCVPPLLEELNSSRRQMAVLAQQLVNEGLDTFVMDYYGTGDSEGQDHEVSFEYCVQSLSATVEWIVARGYQSIVLWGVRIGALLIAELLKQKPAATILGVLFWQPLESGEQWISALQRLQKMSGKTANDNQYFEVAGYQLSETLLEPVRQFDWASYQSCLAEYPLEIVQISPVARPTERTSQVFSTAQNIHQVEGTPFWSIAETPVNPALTADTLPRLQKMAKCGIGENA